MNNDTLDKWFKDKEISTYKVEKAALWPNSIFFFDHGLFLHLDEHREFDKNSSLDYYYKIFRANEKEDKAWQLALLITFLVATCENENTFRIPPRSLKIIDWHEAERSHDRFRPKDGHSILR